MYDTVIRGGNVIDGLGQPARSADVAITNGLIAEVGKVTGAARQEIDADGAIVTPGFLDIHTHYDGQFLWDDRIDPSFSHGVTTAIGGNCGVGFAPVAPEYRKALMEMMEGVEDIPDAVIEEGLDWRWRTFGDYLDRMGERRYAMDVGLHLTHAPLRVFVMGERGLRHEQATPADIAVMCEGVREAMAAGAMGFSSGRLTQHISSRGAHIPGTYARDEELFALSRALGESGHGVFQLIPMGATGNRNTMGQKAMEVDDRLVEHRRIEKVARLSGRPVTYTILEFDTDPDDIMMMVDASEQAAKEGLNLRPQAAARGFSMIHMLDTYHPFALKPSYREIQHLPLKDRAAAMRDPARRRAILSEPLVEGEYANMPTALPLLKRVQADVPISYILKSTLDYEPGEERRVAALAASAGKTPEELVYDHYVDGDGSNFTVSFGFNYVHGNLDSLHHLLQRPNVVSGLSDGGAHMRIICDASMPTFQLAFWARDRKRGDKLPLELMVKKLSSELAGLYGLGDRGAITVGKRADLNVLDFERLTVKAPRVANDLPSGGARLLQASEGYLATFVAGQMTRSHDEDTGARPGRLVRGASPVH